MEEEIFSFETSMDSFLRLNANFRSTEQESALLHQQDVGVDDDEKEITATTQQAAVRKESVSPTDLSALSIVFFPFCPRKLPQQVRTLRLWMHRMRELLHRGAFTISIFRRQRVFSVYLFVFSDCLRDDKSLK